MFVLGWERMQPIGMWTTGFASSFVAAVIILLLCIWVTFFLYEEALLNKLRE